MSHTPRTDRLVLVPGLGVGPELYLPQRAIPARIDVMRWLAPEARETLESYGKRMAEGVALRPDEDLHLGGVSFGGLVALEMAKHLPARRVFLIASARSRRDLPAWYVPGILAAQVTPTPLLRGLRWMSPMLIRFAGRFDRAERELAVKVVRGMDLDVARWSLLAMLRWRGQAPTGIPIHRIHGTRDWILPAPEMGEDPDVTYVPGGGHLMNISRACEVNAVIDDRLGSQP